MTTQTITPVASEALDSFAEVDNDDRTATRRMKAARMGISDSGRLMMLRARARGIVFTKCRSEIFAEESECG